MVDNSIEFEVKRYLMKLISDRYQTLRSAIYKAFGQNGYSAAYTEIANGFLGDNFSNERREISAHKAQFSKKGYADYNYFDLDSLYSYLEYLTRLTNTINDYAWHNSVYRVNAKIFKAALDDTIVYFCRHKNHPSTGYYKGYVTLDRKSDGVTLNPTKTDNKKVDMSKAKVYQEFISEYFRDKYGSPKGFSQIDTFSRGFEGESAFSEDKKNTQEVEEGKAPEDEYDDDFDILEYSYKGQMLRLQIHKEDKYYSEEGFPVYRLWAYSEYGQLIKTVDTENNTYNGALYNGDGDLELLPEESGRTFYPSSKFKKEFGEFDNTLLIAKVKKQNPKTTPKPAIKEEVKVEVTEREPKTKKLKNGLENYVFDFDNPKGVDD